MKDESADGVAADRLGSGRPLILFSPRFGDAAVLNLLYIVAMIISIALVSSMSSDSRSSTEVQLLAALLTQKTISHNSAI